jgi:multimeric flavodoxin WrbA
MAILVINGSPKGQNSNTLRLTRAFLSGAGYDGAEIADVHKMNVKPCLGCFACWGKTPGKCVIDDDMPAFLDKIVAADIIVWSFPLYWFSVPGSLKNVIDRMLPMNLPFMARDAASGGHPSRYDLSEQRHAVISTCGFWTDKGNYEAVDAQFSHICGDKGFTALYCGQGELFRVPELRARTDEYLELVRQAGAEFAGSGVTAATSAALSEPLYPREVFEEMADVSWGISRDGEKTDDDSLNFVRQMAALYRPDGKERVIEFVFTDIDRVYQIRCTPDGHSVLHDGFLPPTTRIETPYAVWKAIARGEITGQNALFLRQYSVSGDFDTMIHWDDLFGGAPAARPAPAAAANAHKTNMCVLLAPWMLIWVAMAIDPIVGGALGVASAALLPLIWLKFEPTLYERITVALVSVLSVSLLCGAGATLIVPLSYLLFGVMWSASGLAKIPLTAWYSRKSYGGERAFSNPLFMRTNRILTLCWGVLYLITPIWTYFLMTSPISPLTGLINSVCPALLGVFTKWFQKWYPKQYARGDF